jgi:hypothetical protein
VALEIVGGYLGEAGVEDFVGVRGHKVLGSAGVEGPQAIEDVFRFWAEREFGLAVGGDVLLGGQFGGDFLGRGGS